MSKLTVPHSSGTNRAPGFVSSSDGFDPRADEGLRQALRTVIRSSSWDHPAGRRLLAEIRRRAVRNAAHVAELTGAAMGHGLVDKVVSAARPWAYLMSSAQKQVLDEVRA